MEKKTEAEIKFENLLHLNLDDPDNKEKLSIIVSRLKWFKDKSVNIDGKVLEKLYYAIRKKYPVTIGYIQHASTESFLVMIKTTDTHKWINTIYGRTMEDIFLKVILVLYGYIEKGYMQHDNSKDSNIRES